MLRALLRSQTWLSREFDKRLPEKFRIDGNRDYIDRFVPGFLGTNLTVYDVGGGKRPYLSIDRKKELNATVVGIDIDAGELDRAPSGAYDQTIVHDISNYRGSNDADLLICQAVLEHVSDVEGAFAAISSILKPGGIALIFVPSRNAAFARLNLILPQKLKQRILYSIFPQTKDGQGFPSFYHKCTPRDFKQLAEENGLLVTQARYYYTSAYFSFVFPAHLCWRLWVLFFSAVCAEQAAETFSFAMRKTELTRDAPVW